MYQFTRLTAGIPSGTVHGESSLSGRELVCTTIVLVIQYSLYC